MKEQVIKYLNFLTREQLVNKCQRIDPNGIWSDYNSNMNEMDVLTKKEAMDQLIKWTCADGEQMTVKQVIKL